MLADVLTMQENFNYDLKGRTVVFMADAANNVARSMMVVCAKLGMNFVACAPETNWPEAELVEECRAIAAEHGATVKLTADVKEGCTDATSSTLTCGCPWASPTRSGASASRTSSPTA